MTGIVSQAVPLDVALHQAVAHHQAGRLQEAEQMYRAILQVQPDQPDANHNMGVLALQVGQHLAGLPYLKAALAINPSQEQYLLSYADALLATDQAKEALSILQTAMKRGLNTAAAQSLKKRAEIATMSDPADRGTPTPMEMSQLVALFNSGHHVELEERARSLIGRYPDSGFVWKIIGASLQAQGKDALPALRKAIELLPGDAAAHSNLGVALGALGQHDSAVASYRRALEINPDYAFAHNNLGVALKNLGQLDGAVTSYRRALEIKSDYAEAHNNLGIALNDLGQVDDAVASWRRALEIKPAFADAHYALGIALQGRGQLESAVASYRMAVQIKPGLADAHNNLAIALKDLGKFDDAVASYRRALEIKPDYAEAHNNLGIALKDLGKLGDAVTSYRRAIESKPDFDRAHNNLGIVLQALGQVDDAVASYRRALEIKPDFADAHINLGAALGSQGKLSDAKACLQKAQGLGFNGAWALDALMLPAILGTRQEMMESRAEFARNLDRLLAKAPPPYDPLQGAEGTNFYLAFHGLNDRDLQVKVAKYYEHACPSLQYTAPHCTKPRSGPPKIKVGFLSKFLSDHSVSSCYGKIIEMLPSRGQFDVTLISNRPIDENIYPGVAAAKCVYLPNDLTLSRTMIAALELDILIYLDIGMEPLSYFLAFSRLARVQCVLAGHPVTTGIPNVDYFLSTDLMELPDADDHYSEKLVRLPRPLYYFTRPTLPATYRTRSELGLPDGRHIYMCPMKLQKIHPDFDEAIARILQLDENGVIVLFEDHMYPFWKTSLLERFEKTIPAEVRERIVFLPWLSNKTDFVSAIAAADVILDPFHFGIGTTAIMTFITGTPLVTKAGDFLRGRIGMGLCTMMDLPECIAESTETYAQKAVEIAGNPSMRKTLSAKILKNNDVMYENLQSVDELAEFLGSLSDSLARQS